MSLWFRTASRAKIPAKRPLGNAHVIFVGGVQRSGTNLVMDILELSPDTEVFHESDRRAFQEFQLRDDAVLDSLVKSGAPYVVFKALCDNDRITALLQRFTPASAIWVYRHYDEVVASHLAIKNWSRNQIDDLVRDRSSAGWRGRGMTDETWSTIKKHYHSDLNRASAIALFWYYRNQLYFDQQLEREPRVYLLKYEELLADPQTEIGRLARFLCITTTPRMEQDTRGGSLRRKRVEGIDEPIRDLCDSMFRRLEIARLQQPKI